MRLAILSTHPIQYHVAWFGPWPHELIWRSTCIIATRPHLRNTLDPVSEWSSIGTYRCSMDTHIRSSRTSPNQLRRSFGGFDTPEVKEIIKSHEFDAVLVNGWHYKSAWQAICPACRQSAVKVIVRGDSHLHTPRNIAKRAVKSFAYRRFIPRFDACLSAAGRVV